MTLFLSYLGHGSFSQDTHLILEVLLPLEEYLRLIYHQLGGQAADLAFTAHSGLLKMKAFSGKCSLQGSRRKRRGKHTVDGVKGRWPEALLAGRVECLQTCYFPAQKRACKDHSCWVTPGFISQLIKEASFSPSFPFLLCISGVVHRQTRPGLVQLALA